MIKNIYNLVMSNCWEKKMTHFAYGKFGLGISMEWSRVYPISFPECSKCWSFRKEEFEVYSDDI